MIHQTNPQQAHLDQNSLIDHWVDKAQKHYQQKNKSGAKYWAEKVTKIDLDNILALNLLGRIALDDNRLDDACALLNKALKKAPSDNSTLLNLGYTYLAMADYRRADDVFNVILDCDENHSNARISVAYSQLLQGHYEIALSHYLALYREGISNPHIVSGMADCCAQLEAKSYLPELERDLLSLYQHTHDKSLVRPEQLSSLANSLLIHKYQLNNPDSQIDIGTLAQDDLLILLLEHGGINCQKVESLVQAIRASILIESQHTRSFNDDYLAMAHAIACQSAANDYLLDVSADESIAIELLLSDIEAVLASNWQTDDMVGAFLLLSLYEPLYTQRFSSKIAQYDLADWPIGIQKVMDLHYYQAQSRHMISYDIKRNHGEANTSDFIQESSIPAKFWQTLTPQGASSYIHSIQNELQNCHIAANKLYKPSRVLVIGCDAGFNALSLAYNYPELSIVASEPTVEGLAHAMIKAQEYQLKNVEFRYGSLDNVIKGDTFDFVECGRYLNYLNEINTPLHQLLEALNPEGIIKLGLNSAYKDTEREQLKDFITSRGLAPDHINVRAIRAAIIEDNTASNEWNKTVKSSWFYQYHDFVDHLFTAQNTYTEDDVSHLCQLHDLNFLGFNQLTQKTANDNKELKFYASRFDNQASEMIFIKPAVLI